MNRGTRSGSGKNFQNKGREVLMIDEMARLDPKECIVFTQSLRRSWTRNSNTKHIVCMTRQRMRILPGHSVFQEPGVQYP